MSFMKWLVALAVSPVAVGLDIITLWGAVNDRRKSYTQELVESVND